MIQILRIDTNDDVERSMSVSAKNCESFDCAKKTVLNQINNMFEGEWETLEEASKELSKDIECNWSDDKMTFYWNDNGKSERYIIAEVKTNSSDFQRIG